MKKYLRTAIAAALTLAAYNVNAQVETPNATTELETAWSYQEGEENNSGDAELFLNGESTVHFTLIDNSPAKYAETNYWGEETGDSVSNVDENFIAKVVVYSKSGTAKATKYFGFVRTAWGKDGHKIYPFTSTTPQTTSGWSSSTYYLYNETDVVTDSIYEGSITISNGEADDYLSLEIVAYSGNTQYGYTSYTSSRTNSGRVSFGDGSCEVNFLKLSTTTLRYDIYDDKPLWAQSSENTESSATADIQSNRLNVKTHGTTEISVYVHRKLVSGTWGTFCLPFNVKVSDMKSANALGSDAVIAEFDNVDLDNDVVNFKTISSSTTTLTAGKPYLIKYTGENKDAFYAPNVTFNYTTTAAQTSLNTLSNRKSTKTSHDYYYTGLLEPTQYNASSESIGSGYMVYISSNIESDGQHLKRLSSGGSIKGFRAYLYYPANAGAKATSGKGVIKIEDGLNDPTAITKVTVDGQQVSNLIYNLQGQCVGTDAAELKAGIYVRGGKKFVVK